MTRGRVIFFVVAALAGFCLWAWLHDGGESVRRLVGGTYGADGRLTFYLGKSRVACPAQNETTAVILALGQSNIANHSEHKVTSRHPGAVLNYAAGDCYVAASPLLGATGEEGEFLTSIGDRLIDQGVYKTVILVPFAVGSSEIHRWRRGGDLNSLLMPVLQDLTAHYWVTEVLWDQGESDLRGTSTADYIASFDSLMATALEKGVRAPVFLAITTHCGEPWTADNPVARAQHSLTERDNFHLGADRDRLLGPEDRRDGCHMKESGQEKVAAAYADAIARVHKGGR